MTTSSPRLTAVASADELSRAAARMVQLGAQAMSETMRAGRPLMRAYLELIETGVPALRGLSKAGCRIPETECPPYCVCDMRWHATPGDKRTGTIRVTNTGKAARTFTFEATAFEGGAGDSGLKATLSPSSAPLDPGQSQVVAVEVNVPDDFAPGSYDAEVKIRGLYEQCVRLDLEVAARDSAHCDVKQGEIPTRLRAHNWYDHFQCEELCFEPVQRVAVGKDETKRKIG